MEKIVKKRIIFVIESLNLGGAEKSLVTLLNLLDYSKYEVDLLLFAQGGPFQELLPEKVTLLSVPDYCSYTCIPWHSFGEKLKNPMALFAQLRYSLALRLKKHTNIEKAALLWKYSQSCFTNLPESYDVAIAYAQGLPTFFVSDKVSAKKKYAWINAIYKPCGRYLNYVKALYKEFDLINAVSDTVKSQICETFGFKNENVTVIKDILDANFILKMADMISPVLDEMCCKGVKIVTVGRLAHMKAYDIAIDAARILKSRGFDFHWYAIGEGGLRGELEKQIADCSVSDCFTLLGARANPYPYMKNADIYVQTSRFEGYCLTLAEARMLNVPCVTTEFDVVHAQMLDGENGLIVGMNAESVADGIMRLAEDRELYEHIKDYLKHEKKGNTEEIEKFYALLEG